jgi:hypothetical protein
MPAVKNAVSMIQNIAKSAQKPAGSVQRNAGKWREDLRLLIPDLVPKLQDYDLK